MVYNPLRYVKSLAFAASLAASYSSVYANQDLEQTVQNEVQQESAQPRIVSGPTIVRRAGREGVELYVTGVPQGAQFQLYTASCLREQDWVPEPTIFTGNGEDSQKITGPIASFYRIGNNKE
ncbi:MAG: hypothetical protein ACMXYK_00770 [Candidatus Woesearchaeota archaeon]